MALGDSDVSNYDGIGRLHVYPLNDLREHETDGAPCWCKPVETSPGVIVHNSMDGREAYECGERKPH